MTQVDRWASSIQAPFAHLLVLKGILRMALSLVATVYSEFLSQTYKERYEENHRYIQEDPIIM
ncbi:hypothetical protein D3C84_1016760 [compost metagenome]